MIKNSTQYHNIKKLIEDFDSFFIDYEAKLNTQDLHPIQKKFYLDIVKQKHLENIAEIEEYEAIKNKEVSQLQISNIDDFPKLMIQSRISKGWSHKDLAEKLMTQEQQVQRFEQNDYLTTSFERVLQAMRALGIEITATKKVCQTKFFVLQSYNSEKINKIKEQKRVMQYAQL